MSEKNYSYYLNEIQKLKQIRTDDIKSVQKVLLKNAELKSKLGILQHCDIKLSEINFLIQNLLNRYKEGEKEKLRQQKEISILQEGVEIAKSRQSISDFYN
jgi:hypothetical protein